MAEFSASVLYNGLGRYKDAFAAARGACVLDELGLTSLMLVELIEAAVRSGEPKAAALALRSSLKERAWGHRLGARHRGSFACPPQRRPGSRDLYLEAIARLERCRVRAHLARAHLLYGEWLRRHSRRLEARGPLRTAHEMLATMGAEGFAERAARELLATGETVRKRVAETRNELARARAPITNPEIGTQLFISPRTVEYHLHKVFLKLGISPREASATPCRPRKERSRRRGHERSSSDAGSRSGADGHPGAGPAG